MGEESIDENAVEEKPKQVFLEILSYATMIEKLITSELEAKSEESRNTPSERRLDDDKLR